MKLSFKFDEAAAKDILPWLRDNTSNMDAKQVFLRTTQQWADSMVHLVKWYEVVSTDDDFNTLFKLCWSDICTVAELPTMQWAMPHEAIKHITKTI